ncbi:hypothetical protein ACFX1X_020855 [Malus domestica]
MNNILGLLRLRIKRGINLAIRDVKTSDPYVMVTMGSQKLKTKVIKRNCNPQWDQDLTLSITNLEEPIHLQVYDKDTLTVDDKMGDADIDIKPYVECLKMGLDADALPKGCALMKVLPNRTNCLSTESCCGWENGKIVQDMILKLRNVECGEIVVQIEWINLPGSKGLEGV